MFALQHLSPNERAALRALLNRRPLFKWEREALSESTHCSLEEKGLIARHGEQWRVTELVLGHDLRRNDRFRATDSGL